jgi:DNA modification methylase
MDAPEKERPFINKILTGDVISQLRLLPDEFVQCVVTSPPYWGLRRYAGEQEIAWGGDDKCEHEWGRLLPCHHPGQVPWEAKGRGAAEGQLAPSGQYCQKCSAWRGAFGLEPTIELYVEHTVQILREIRRVLRKDGVCFWNIGDSYNAGRTGGWAGGKHGMSRPEIAPQQSGVTDPGLKPKDLCMIPFRVALAAQADGWWVRMDIVWNKPNPMPESVTDRPTKSHEYILMLTKSGTHQYWTHRDKHGTRTEPDADWRWRNNITEEEVTEEPTDWKGLIICPECEGTGEINGWLGPDECHMCEDSSKNIDGKRAIRKWTRFNLWTGHDYYWDQEAVREPHQANSIERVKTPVNSMGGPHGEFGAKISQGGNRNLVKLNPAGRNIRSVWTIATQPYSEAHFATFPEEIPKRAILAGTSAKGRCPKCGAPWERIVKRTPMPRNDKRTHSTETQRQGKTPCPEPTKGITGPSAKTIGWEPTCDCGLEPIPCVVLDPFMGAGTTGLVALNNGRNFVGIEIHPGYVEMAYKRIDTPLKYHKLEDFL